MDSFCVVHKFFVREEAKKAISDYSMSALAYGGSKEDVKKHLKPLQDILEDGSEEDAKQKEIDKNWRDLASLLGS